jgi:histidinol-phosphate aminotransferase
MRVGGTRRIHDIRQEPIRLYMNEMPYPPPQRVIEAGRTALSKLNRYTDPDELEELRAGLADYAGVPQRHTILGPGSDLLLREIIHQFSRGRQVVMVSPSFLPTVEAARHFATRWLRIKLSPPAFDLPLDLLADALDEPSLVIMDNPNNPTGRVLLDRQMIATITERQDILLVIDEAYYEFSGLTFADMVACCPNLAVTRTMDKAFSLAGARVGYAIAGEAFEDVFSSFYAFLPQPSLSAALAALENPDYVGRNVRRVIEERERVRQSLDEADTRHALGTHVYPSSTNFLLVRTRISDIARRLQEMGVLVSDVSDQLPRGLIRVSIGTPEENDAFLDAYNEIHETGA